jgi:hypothetical protein
MKHYIAAFSALAASCTYAPAWAEKVYKEVTCGTIAQAAQILRQQQAERIISFETGLGFALVAETPKGEIVIMEFVPKDDLACLIIDGKKLKGV